MTKNEEIQLKDLLLNDSIFPDSIYDGQYTKTTQFMLPSISIDIKNRIVFKFFINSFLDDKKIEHNYTRPIFVLFGVKDYKDREWNKVYSALVLSKDYIYDYDCGVKDGVNLVMMVFTVPFEYEKDYYNFKKGRYSRFSPSYKEKFSKTTSDNTAKESVIWQIINKSPKLKRELEKEFGLNEGELDKPTIIRNGKEKKIYPPAEEIWDIPRKEREYYRYSEKEVLIS